jgi:hypothetical protein
LNQEISGLRSTTQLIVIQVYFLGERIERISLCFHRSIYYRLEKKMYYNQGYIGKETGSKKEGAITLFSKRLSQALPLRT